MATYNNIKKIKIGDNIFNLYDSGNSGGTITSITTTAGAHTAINVTSGAVNFNVPTKTSHLTNDSGFTNNTGTVTKVTAGTGLSIGTTAGGNFTTTGTINHTNSVTAQTTQALYPIKIDAQGHISAYGSAVTSLPASDVYDWAKAASKPSYTASEVGAVPTTRTINGKALSSDISLVPSDIGAAAASAIPEVATVISVNVTTSTGQYVDSVCRKYGRVVQLAVGVRNTSAVASGSNFYLGTFNSALPAPIMITTSATYYGKHPVTAALNAGRELTIRNTSTSSVTIGSSSTLYVTLTYLTTD